MTWITDKNRCQGSIKNGSQCKNSSLSSRLEINSKFCGIHYNPNRIKVIMEVWDDEWGRCQSYKCDGNQCSYENGRSKGVNYSKFCGMHYKVISF